MIDVDTVIKRMDNFLCIRDGVLPTIPMACTLEDREWLTLRAEIDRLRSELAAERERADDLRRDIGLMPCCPICCNPKVDSATARTVYACGSSDYDKRRGTFKQSLNCMLISKQSELAILAARKEPT